ncbi:MAG: hypothetical protein MJ007_02085 [Paludibacteraceae bacterium]|nr:hypothetical protein [Paludibacteraceae bacterium]
MAREGLMDDSGYNFNECDGECDKCDQRDICDEEDCIDEWNKYYYDTRL